MESKGIIYYTDNRLDDIINTPVRNQILKSQLPIVSVSLQPIQFGKNIWMNLPRGYSTMFMQILTALEACDTEIVFFCEHDVLYHPSHFNFTPRDKNIFYYNVNVWKIRLEDGFALKVNNCRQVSGISVYRETAITHYRERIEYIKKHTYTRDMGFEPGTHKRIKWGHEYSSDIYESEFPNLDIRHDKTLTINRWTKDKFRNQKFTEGWTESNINNLPGWEDLKLINNK